MLHNEIRQFLNRIQICQFELILPPLFKFITFKFHPHGQIEEGW